MHRKSTWAFGGLFLLAGSSSPVCSQAPTDGLTGQVTAVLQRVRHAYTHPFDSVDLSIALHQTESATSAQARTDLWTYRWVEEGSNRRAEVTYPLKLQNSGATVERESWLIDGPDNWEINFNSKTAYKNLLKQVPEQHPRIVGHFAYLDRFVRPDPVWDAILSGDIGFAEEVGEHIVFEYQRRPGLKGRAVGLIEQTPEEFELRKLVLVVATPEGSRAASRITFGPWENFGSHYRPTSMTYESGPLTQTIAEGTAQQLLNWAGESRKVAEVIDLKFDSHPPPDLFLFVPPDDFTVFGPDSQGRESLIQHPAMIERAERQEQRRAQAAAIRQESVTSRLASAQSSAAWGHRVMWIGIGALAVAIAFVLASRRKA